MKIPRWVLWGMIPVVLVSLSVWQSTRRHPKETARLIKEAEQLRCYEQIFGNLPPTLEGLHEGGRFNKKLIWIQGGVTNETIIGDMRNFQREEVTSYDGEGGWVYSREGRIVGLNDWRWKDRLIKIRKNDRFLKNSDLEQNFEKDRKSLKQSSGLESLPIYGGDLTYFAQAGKLRKADLLVELGRYRVRREYFYEQGKLRLMIESRALAADGHAGGKSEPLPLSWIRFCLDDREQVDDYDAVGWERELPSNMDRIERATAMRAQAQELLAGFKRGGSSSLPRE